MKKFKRVQYKNWYISMLSGFVCFVFKDEVVLYFKQKWFST